MTDSLNNQNPMVIYKDSNEPVSVSTTRTTTNSFEQDIEVTANGNRPPTLRVISLPLHLSNLEHNNLVNIHAMKRLHREYMRSSVTIPFDSCIHTHLHPFSKTLHSIEHNMCSNEQTKLCNNDSTPTDQSDTSVLTDSNGSLHGLHHFIESLKDTNNCQAKINIKFLHSMTPERLIPDELQLPHIDEPIYNSVCLDHPESFIEKGYTPLFQKSPSVLAHIPSDDFLSTKSFTSDKILDTDKLVGMSKSSIHFPNHPFLNLDNSMSSSEDNTSSEDGEVIINLDRDFPVIQRASVDHSTSGLAPVLKTKGQIYQELPLQQTDSSSFHNTGISSKDTSCLSTLKFIKQPIVNSNDLFEKEPKTETTAKLIHLSKNLVEEDQSSELFEIVPNISSSRTSLSCVSENQIKLYNSKESIRFSESFSHRKDRSFSKILKDNVLSPYFERVFKSLYPPISTCLDIYHINKKKGPILRSSLQMSSEKKVFYNARLPSSQFKKQFNKKTYELNGTSPDKAIISSSSYLHTPTVSPNSKRRLSHRNPTFSEELLYNKQSYAFLNTNSRNDLKLQTASFELSWTPIRPLSYYVQDHGTDCVNLSRWPTEKMKESAFAYNYRVKCHCPFERAISFFIAPFHFQAFRHTNQKTVIPLYTPLGQIETTSIGLLGDPMKHQEMYVSIRSEKDNDSPKRLNKYISRHFRSRSMHYSTQLYKSSVTIENYPVRLSCLNSLKKQSTRGHYSHLKKKVSKPFIQQRLPSRTTRQFFRGVSIKQHCPKLSMDHQYIREISPNVWLRSRSCYQQEMKHLNLIVLFGGKDMLALHWLSFIAQWIQQDIQTNMTPFHTNDKKKKKDSYHTTNGGHYGSSSLRRPSDPKIPRYLPKFDNELFQRQRRCSIRNTTHRQHPTFFQEQQETSDSTHHMSQKNNYVPTTNIDHAADSLTSFHPICETHSTIKLCVNVAFGLVEYPGYGHGEGLPSPSSCVDSGIEVIRNIIGYINPETVAIHIIGYSLGCAIALRVANIIADQVCINNDLSSVSSETTLQTDATNLNPILTSLNQNMTEPLLKIKSFKNILLIAPFTTTWDCLNSILHIPKGLQHVSKFVFDTVSNKHVQFDNKDALGRLCQLIRKAPDIFSGLNMTILFGDQDQVMSECMGPSLAAHAREILGKKLLDTKQISINCIRVTGADHNTVMNPTRLIKVLTKHHVISQFCSVESV